MIDSKITNILRKAGWDVNSASLSNDEYSLIDKNGITGELRNIDETDINDIRIANVVYIVDNGFVKADNPDRFRKYFEWKKINAASLRTIAASVMEYAEQFSDNDKRLEYAEVCEMLRHGDISLIRVINDIKNDVTSKNTESDDYLNDYETEYRKITSILNDYYVNVYSVITKINPEVTALCDNRVSSLFYEDEDSINTMEYIQLRNDIEKLAIKMDTLLLKMDLLSDKYEYVLGLSTNIPVSTLNSADEYIIADKNIMETVPSADEETAKVNVEYIQNAVDEQKYDNADIKNEILRLAERITDVLYSQQQLPDASERLKIINTVANDINNEDIESYILQLNEMLVSHEMAPERYKGIEGIINDLTIADVGIPDRSVSFQPENNEAEKDYIIIGSGTLFSDWLNRQDKIDNRIKIAMSKLEFVVDKVTSHSDIDVIVKNEKVGFKKPDGNHMYNENMSSFIITLNEIVSDRGCENIVKEVYDEVKAVERQLRNRVKKQ